MRVSTQSSATAQAVAALVISTGVAVAGPVSGLPWPSGAKDGIPCLQTNRGRQLDVQHFHMGAAGNTWADQVHSAQTWVSNDIATGSPYTLVSPWLLTTGSKGDFAGCAAGNFDGSWQQIAAAFKSAAGSTHTVIIEPGWEAAIGSNVHPWGYDYASQIPTYVACWKHVVTVMRGVFPGAIYAWTNARRYPETLPYSGSNGTATKTTVAAADPGGEDAYGMMAYDTAAWSTELNQVNANGDPSGFATWLSYARGKGKKLGLSEWGLRMGDDPAYIANMFGFLKANAASIGWDAYQNNDLSTTGHELCPSTNWPNSASRYWSVWRAG